MKFNKATDRAMVEIESAIHSYPRDEQIEQCVGLACWLLIAMESRFNEGLRPKADISLTLGRAKRIIAFAEGCLKANAPYGEWCRKPAACAGKGYCPLDPTCGD